MIKQQVDTTVPRMRAVNEAPPTVVGRSLLIEAAELEVALEARIEQLQAALDSALAEVEVRNAGTAKLALEAALEQLEDSRPNMRRRTLDAIRRVYLADSPSHPPEENC